MWTYHQPNQKIASWLTMEQAQKTLFEYLIFANLRQLAAENLFFN